MGDDNVHIGLPRLTWMFGGKPTRTAGAAAPRSGSGAAAALGLPG